MVAETSGSNVKSGNPFSNNVMADELPTAYRPLAFEYDGTMDPQDHLCWFENAALLHHFSNRVKCRVFLTMLTNAAQKRFTQLPPVSIGSFDDFSFLFH